MSLVNLQTNLKSLKFGRDRKDLGDSNQPYITTPIPGNDDPSQGLGVGDLDFLWRGGINAPRDTFRDVSRLTKFFFDFKTPTGITFTAKQNILSRMGVRTQASGRGVNEGIYTPLTTLAQAGINFTGLHIPKQGAIPFVGPNTYLGTLEKRDNIFQFNRIIAPTNNRLIQLNYIKREGNVDISGYESLFKANQVSTDPTELLSYGGGPNSVVGFSKTKIKLATDNMGAPLQTGVTNFKLYNGNMGFSSGVQIPEKYKPYIKFRTDNQDDFRKNKLDGSKGISTIMGLAPSYNPNKNKTIENNSGKSRINYASPGQRGNVIDYTQGKLDSTGKKIGAVDRINALPIYKSRGVIQSPVKNDLVKFRIAALDSENPREKVYMHFRAFIDSFSDNYNASWTPQKYMGRGEELYKYDSFKRDINLSFTVAAQSKPEIMEMYRKLNFLASNLSPDYTSAGYMAGPLVQLTLGGWCYELPGFISSLTLDIPQESPWEIGINTEGNFDKTVKEMPMICKVTSMTFTPIHKFTPQKQKNKYGNGILLGENEQELQTVKEDISGNGKYDGYGPQRYIQLDDGGGNNGYDNTHRTETNFLNAVGIENTSLFNTPPPKPMEMVNIEPSLPQLRPLPVDGTTLAVNNTPTVSDDVLDNFT
jgi:hypothetical protein